MADTAASILGPAVTELARWVGASIKRQFNYLCCFTTNIDTLKKESEELQATTEDLKVEVDRANDNLRVITGKVEIWLQKSKDITDEKEKILEEVQNVGSGCLKLRARFCLSKRAKKTSDLMKVLRDERNKFNADCISLSPPPAARQPVPLERTYEFQSRKQIEEDIMETLRLGDVNMMGICGMGGLGKTTMAKRVMNRALEEHAFEEVVMVVVSQPIDKSRVQLEIGGSLGLRMEGESWQARVQKLHARLSGTKRILLVLDDVWETFVLEDLGIPSNHKGCTILTTSRNHDVLTAMNVGKVFGMQVLSESDAWFLFQERVGMCVDDTKLNSMAKKVVNECEGLPIALATVGAALRNVMNVGIWKDALRRLEQSAPNAELKKNVYNPLKLSYDVLEPIHKSVFLLCCLYPEDSDIPLEHLTYYCMELGIFERGVRNVEEARDNLQASAHMLKSRSLLLDSKYGDDEYVRMHDVVRDVCIFIAEHERKIGGDDCSWISSFHRSEFPTDLEFSNLRLLLLDDYSANEKLKLGCRFLEGISDLRVLCIHNNKLLTSLPLTTQSLQNLKTLVLKSCSGLEALSGVGELVNLEILNCSDCTSVKELPLEMKRLNRLKLLDLTRCRGLKRIGRGIISSLVALEELKMLGSFSKWEVEDREERENAALKELEALTDLRYLVIQIQDPALAMQNMRLSSKIDKFDIRFPTNNICQTTVFVVRSKKKMCVVLEEERCIGDWIEMQFLRDAECLDLEGNGANKVDLTKSKNIRFLRLSNCESMKKIVTYTMDDCGGATRLSHIEYLMLSQLPRLELIWDGQISPVIYQNLKELHLEDLPALKQVWKGSSRAMDFVPQLEVLSIVSCEIMEPVFLLEGEDVNEENSIQSPNSHHLTTKILPKLKELYLIALSNLTSFCKGIRGIEFPQLRKFQIYRCYEMKIMVPEGKESNENSSNKAQIEDHRCQMSFGCLKELRTDWDPFCDCKIGVSFFNGLEELIIEEYKGSMSFIEPSIAENLVNLKVLWILQCGEMVKVIGDDEEKLVSGSQRTLLFPKLHTLELFELRKLVSFCEWKCDVGLPSLRELRIWCCHNMEYFTLGRLDTPNLETFRIDREYVDLGVEKDLNGMLQQHHFTRQKNMRWMEEDSEEEGGSEEEERESERKDEQNS